MASRYKCDGAIIPGPFVATGANPNEAPGQGMAPRTVIQGGLHRWLVYAITSAAQATTSISANETVSIQASGTLLIAAAGAWRIAGTSAGGTTTFITTIEPNRGYWLVTSAQV